MTKQMMVDVAAVLTTILDCGVDAPESSIYLAFGTDFERFQTIKQVIVGANLVIANRNSTLSLTETGRQIAVKCNEALASK